MHRRTAANISATCLSKLGDGHYPLRIRQCSALALALAFSQRRLPTRLMTRRILSGFDTATALFSDLCSLRPHVDDDVEGHGKKCSAISMSTREESPGQPHNQALWLSEFVDASVSHVVLFPLCGSRLKWKQDAYPHASATNEEAQGLCRETNLFK